MQKTCAENDKLKNAINSVKQHMAFIDTSIRETEIPELKLEVHFAVDGWIMLQGAEKKLYRNDKGRQIEGIKLSIMEDTFHGSIFYAVKVNYREDWTDTYSNGRMAGTTGKKMPMNAVKIWLDDVSARRYSVHYKVRTNANEVIAGQDGSAVELEKRNIMVFLEVWLKYRAE